jgi:N-acyl-phosphatidylethanolamine-hydrolysing phospholipase D
MPHYTNLDGTTPDKDLRALLKWQIADRIRGKKRKDPGGFVTPHRDNDGRALASAGPSLTWIGHATYVQRLGGALVATDPIWSERLGPRRRLAPAGVALGDLPPIDVVTVSHSHYDHLDLPTLRRLGDGPVYIVPLDVGELLRREGLTKVVELGWWQSHVVDDLRVTLVPAQHWSMRVPWDRNKRLWGGFVYESREGTSYHAGDTAFSEDVFRAIAERFPRIDWAAAAHGPGGGRPGLRDPRSPRARGHALGYVQADRRAHRRASGAPSSLLVRAPTRTGAALDPRRRRDPLARRSLAS